MPRGMPFRVCESVVLFSSLSGWTKLRAGNAGRGLYRLDAWVEDDRVEGVVEVVEHVNVPKGDDYACTSEPVGFTAQR